MCCARLCVIYTCKCVVQDYVLYTYICNTCILYIYIYFIYTCKCVVQDYVLCIYNTFILYILYILYIRLNV